MERRSINNLKNQMQANCLKKVNVNIKREFEKKNQKDMTLSLKKAKKRQIADKKLSPRMGKKTTGLDLTP
jgi:hypothetical protein